MKNAKLLKTLLMICGLIASGIGVTILFFPSALYATYGVELGDNVSLLNEIRAPGGVLLVSGLFIISGAFVDKLVFTSVVVSTLIYLSYGLSRLISIAIDGVPVEALVQAAMLEMVIGAACVFALVKYYGRWRESV